MKKFTLIALIAIIAFATVFTSCSKKAEGSAATAAEKTEVKPTKIVVGATPEPHAEMLKLVVDDMAKLGYTLEVKEFTDYVTPNTAVEDGQIDANFFQHVPYMNSFNTEHNYHLVNAGGIHIEPLALYSSKIKNVNELANGATIAIPNDPTNEGRALLLLESAGLIKLKDSNNLESTPMDVVSNPKSLKFKEIEAASLPRVLADVDAAVINGNYAIPAGLNAAKDGLIVEGANSPYVNIITVKAGNENNPAVKALVDCLKSQEVKDWVAKTYTNGEVVLVF